MIPNHVRDGGLSLRVVFLSAGFGEDASALLIA